ncbi:hypothetical protein pqer_cds_781 [Pandoravirus quercus]|uniref:Uncharacterized protein n=1 Tax=Pandoravirus quercus TaxID=2107709 RepID=A0A2U7U9T6_9VIRU|nr:hypothetical protein pqer_cds_781 [Pandoravirus quercus]AVK75203.1 hypothetical protein pqer_cds_781 [Pandoravirus quercus]
MGGRTRRRWRFWRRALGVALCWRHDGYEPCESGGDDGSHISTRSDTSTSPRSAVGSIVGSTISSSAGSAVIIDSGAGNDDKGRLQGRRDSESGGDDRVCWPSAILGRLAAMEQPIVVRCPDSGDVLYRVDLGEETLECLRGGRRRSWSLTFFMDHEHTDDRRVTLYGLLAPGCEAWTMAFVSDDSGGVCKARVRIEPDHAMHALDE